MTTKKTRSRRKMSDLRLAMTILQTRQTSLLLIVQDALMSMRIQIDDLKKEVERLKKEDEK